MVEIGAVKGGEIEVWLDSTEGTKLGTVSFANSPKMEVQSGVFMRPSGISFKPVAGKHDLVLVFINEKAGEGDLFSLVQLVLGK